MRPKQPTPDPQDDLFRARLENLVDRRHALVRLAGLIDWVRFEAEFGALYTDGGRPGLPTRLMVGLHLLKHMDGLSDEAVCARYLDSPYVQLFCGEVFFQHALPLDRSSLTRWRQRIGPERLELLLAESLAAAQRSGALEGKHLRRGQGGELVPAVRGSASNPRAAAVAAGRRARAARRGRLGWQCCPRPCGRCRGPGGRARSAVAGPAAPPGGDGRRASAWLPRAGPSWPPAGRTGAAGCRAAGPGVPGSRCHAAAACCRSGGLPPWAGPWCRWSPAAGASPPPRRRAARPPRSRPAAAPAARRRGVGASASVRSGPAAGRAGSRSRRRTAARRGCRDSARRPPRQTARPWA